MVSFSCMTIPILLEKLQNCCKSSSGMSGAILSPIQSRFGTQTVFQTLIWNTFLLNSDVKTAVDNWFSGQGRDFYQAGLNKLVLRSDKCLNRFGYDYLEK
ncbi:hypothetical protein AVEN_216341-1 [Araneus ventricosus]|uniref:Uncharacterized protein n=1 Tax=Araneus ventricosus TaxID=182803 RepID=A0A4Y2WIT5_ARAVE|nr:hypothetical protein AVEN_216341-1 [Araneus ventricosus]